jgi:cysteine-S-conjugate beta-lyase
VDEPAADVAPPDAIDLDANFHRITVEQLRQRAGIKWSKYGPDVVAAWVADMDFPIAPAIRRAIDLALDRGAIGYPPDTASLAKLFSRRSEARTGWGPDPGLTHTVSDVVRGVANCIHALTQPDDAVVVMTPIYPPFRKVVMQTRRRLVEVPLVGPPWRYDERAFQHAVVEHRPTMLLMAHPHNPTGLGENDADGIERIATTAVRHGMTVVSDEIWADLNLTHRHRPIASISREIEADCVTITSASKAFNMAGLRCALVAAGSGRLHDRLMALPEDMRHGVGTLGIVATFAAWSPEGDAWLRACRNVLAINLRRVDTASVIDLQGLDFAMPEAGYLAWLDARALDLQPTASRFFLDRAKVALSPGEDFGVDGAGFVRLNVATAPAILELIIRRLAAVLPH